MNDQQKVFKTTNKIIMNYVITHVKEKEKKNEIIALINYLRLHKKLFSYAN